MKTLLSLARLAHPMKLLGRIRLQRVATKALPLCAGLLLLGSRASAQLDLTWDNCAIADLGNGEPAPLTNKTFVCTALRTYRLHGTFKTPVAIPQFYAMDAVVELRQSGALVPFYHYEAGGCNNTGLALSADKSTVGALGDGNACAFFNTPWGEIGEDVQSATVSSYQPDFGEPGVGRMVISIARQQSNPIALVANQNYYGFHLRMTTANRAVCSGCGTPAAMNWSSAVLHHSGGTVTLSGASGKTTSSCALINNGACTAPPPPPPPPAPVIASFSPTSGQSGTLVTINGSNFTGVSSVTFNFVAASFTVVSATQIQAYVPVATTGRIRVTNVGGTGTSSTDFTVIVPPPTISSFSPASGPAGTLVTINGSNFTGSTAVSFNLVAAGFSVLSGSQIRATVPNGATTGRIRVTTSAGTAVSATDFTETASPPPPPPEPTISSFTPMSGPVGTEVMIFGSNFEGVTTVAFSLNKNASFSVLSPTQIRAFVPTGATSGLIRVTSPGGTGYSSDQFGVTTTPPPPPAPAISSFSPATGPEGTLVTINGINFGGATEVTFNFVPSTFTAFGSQIRATVPTGATTGRIRVTTPGGSATSSGDFIVSAAPPPPPPPPPPSGTAQLDLTWDNCVTANLKNGEPAASNGKTFDCSTLNTYRLHGCFKTPVDLPDFFAMDVSMDLQQSAAGALIPFYHYESGGCNASGIALSVDKSTAGALGDGNACANFESPWGALGEQPAFAGITGYAFDFGQPGRGRLLVSISRASDNPVALVANRNYYGFHLRLSTGNREACATCGAPAALVWNSAQLYSTTIPVVTLSGPSAKGTAYCAWIGDAVSGCAATPVRNITWGKLKTMYR